MPPIEPTDELLRKHRRAARIILADPYDRVLLLSSLLEDRGCIIWLAPGGALEDGESWEEAARRECWEETGLRLPEERALEHVWTREHEWSWSERAILSVERYFFVRVERFAPEARQLEGYEEELFRGHRWWAVDELATSDELLVPAAIAARLEPLLEGDFPDEPVEVGA